MHQEGRNRMSRYSIWDKIRYEFDNIMSRGTISLIFLLAVINVATVIFFTALVLLFEAYPDSSEKNFTELFWKSLLRTLDAGTMGSDRGVYGIFMLGVTLIGIVITSSLIGILTTGLQRKLDTLRKGRSKVVVKNHIVILGYSEQLFTILSELKTAHKRGKIRIVIMSEKDKTELENEIKEKVPNIKNVKFICRTGNPTDLYDLSILNINEAKSIIIISQEGDENDYKVIKSILAITKNPNRSNRKFHIVAELRKRENVVVAKEIGRDEVEVVLIDDIISGIIAQTCRQEGLSKIINELLDFKQLNIRFCNCPNLAGQQFDDILMCFEDSTVIGICRENKVIINPKHNLILDKNDQIVLIAKDKKTIKISNRPTQNLNLTNIILTHEVKPLPEKILMLGWNRKSPLIIFNLDQYVTPGTSLTIVSKYDNDSIRKIMDKKLNNLNIEYLINDTTDRKILEELIRKRYDHVIVLPYDKIKSSDDITIITLFHLRDIIEKTGIEFSITTEMKNINNQKLVEIEKINDYVISDIIASLLIAQISENKQVNQLFTDLFNPEGNEIYMKPITNYINIEKPIDFYIITQIARKKGEIPIGYKLHAQKDSGTHGIYLNPTKKDTIKFSEKDSLIVIAEN